MVGVDERVRRVRFAVAALVIAALPAITRNTHLVPIVATSESTSSAVHAVESVGGIVTTQLPIVDGVAAKVPANRIADLSRLVRVAADRTLRVRSASFGGSPETAFPYEVGAVDAWAKADGSGIGVALVDTGVAPVPDLLDRVAAVADVTPERIYDDTFGHGTFMAGLIAGDGRSSGGTYAGVAPGAHLVSIKVAVSDGSTTLGTVLNGLQLVAKSRVAFNIRVLLLAMSSPSTAAPDQDPLTKALRRLWDLGIFVVVPAGNDGPGASSVDSPGLDPVLATAGAVDDLGTPTVQDDVVPDWTGRGPTPWGAAKPDVAAPGVHIVSVRAPRSTVDRENPGARVGDSYFRGSGTSMAAAITAGVAALILSAEPGLTPDQLKHRLIGNATPLPGRAPAAIGAGVVNGGNVPNAPGLVPPPATTMKPAPEHHWNGWVWDGRIWDGRIWDGRIWDGRIWDGRIWNGRVWDGRVWDGRIWNGRVWA
jgi:serine protease AprX